MSTLGSVEYSKAWAKSITNLKIKCVSVESTSAIGRRGNMKRIVFQKARQPRTKWAARYWWTVWRYIFCIVCQTTQIHDSNVLKKDLKREFYIPLLWRCLRQATCQRPTRRSWLQEMILGQTGENMIILNWGGKLLIKGGILESPVFCK